MSLGNKWDPLSEAEYMVQQHGPMSERRAGLLMIAALARIERCWCGSGAEDTMHAVFRFVRRSVEAPRVNDARKRKTARRKISRLIEEHSSSYTGDAAEAMLEAVRDVLTGDQVRRCFFECVSAASAEVGGPAGNYGQAKREEIQAQVSIAVDLLPPHFAPGPHCMTVRHEGTAYRIASSTYEDEAFGDLPILADALEDEGFHEGLVLDHFRGPWPHWRGCWALDYILGRS